jgi:catechol 2,3-dioxygenase-like lactoylglutathione lyase family enzyme
MCTRVDKAANVIIPVDDQDRAVEFYTEKLGLEKRVELRFGPGFRAQGGPRVPESLSRVGGKARFRGQ